MSAEPHDSPAQPRIAVIIPCFNDGPLLEEALASLEGGEPLELVVVDDHSTDEDTHRSLAALEAAGTRVICHDGNRGVAAARMTGLEATRARYVFPLDADDLAELSSLTAMADVLDTHSEAGVCFGDYREFGDSELVRAVPECLDPYRVAYTNEYPVSSLFRRSLLEEVDGWRVRGPTPTFEDWDLWMRLAARGERGIHLGSGRVTYHRRLHGVRLLHRGKANYADHYRQMRVDNPALFARLREHRRASDLPLRRKLLYPLVYGRRPRLPFEPHVKALLDRAGLWTLRR